MLLAIQDLTAQLSKVHYIPPIAAHGAANSNAFPRDQYIYISTPSTDNVNYTIAPMGEVPANYISGVVSNSFPMFKVLALEKLFLPSPIHNFMLEGSLIIRAI